MSFEDLNKGGRVALRLYDGLRITELCRASIKSPRVDTIFMAALNNIMNLPKPGEQPAPASNLNRRFWGPLHSGAAARGPDVDPSDAAPGSGGGE